MMKKKIVIGILAHVDAGKTTLSESLLYKTGSIRKLGRVDYKDAFLDTYDLERERGITIFSKQAIFSLGEREVTLLDTPGHVDFSAEMERTLQVLDYAILVINGADGIQGHTLTLWKLLERHEIPTFLFINKMDQVGTDKQQLLDELKKRLSQGCVDFDKEQHEEEFLENIAVCDESLLEEYLETGEVKQEEIPKLIKERKVFPCFFGSALKVIGVEELLEGLDTYMQDSIYGEQFGAKVYKIARDAQGTRLTYCKITGGSLKVKTTLTNKKEHAGQKEEDIWQEKVDQIRLYSGEKFESVTEVQAGSVCALTGLSKTYPGQGLGIEAASDMPILEPVLTYQILLPEECDVTVMLKKLRQLEEEEPALHIVWKEELGEIHAQLMGEVQIDVMKILIKERFDIEVEFGVGNIVYKETIEEPVEGVGHFEPLRHYAEVHLLLEPLERGSGLVFDTICSEDDLDRNWQRLVLSHLEEKEHRGVLTGSGITDMKLTLVAGKAHQKHTEGGDFRQATYRAIRQGLKEAKSILLEPYYEFRMELPAEQIGRAMADVQKMYGMFEAPIMEEEMAILTGLAPVSTMRDYQKEFISYTRGLGRFFCSLKGYQPCHNQEEVIELIGYDSERDLENPTGSVFCSHGAGFVVPWYQVKEYMHVESPFSEQKENKESYESQKPVCSFDDWIDEDEIEEIFTRTYGAGSYRKRRVMTEKKVIAYGDEKEDTANNRKSGSYEVNKRENQKIAHTKKQYLLVDGYNIIFAWEDLNELAKTNIDAARDKLMDILCNYQGFKKCELILVFDAYKIEGHPVEVIDYHNIHVVYTKEAETADQYIEKLVHEIGRKYEVTVATSDRLEQMIILGEGAKRLSAKDLEQEVLLVNEQIRKEHLQKQQTGKNYLFDQLDEEMAQYMEDIRLGKKEL
ncbi:MAG: TetM/TetW/TetO/TetS family tetracycline resistance ribosomal protection protein [Firmicutes bacterium]|uniref:TetM/TetW/TetO/TetS family tetracycline resistance ribosomal protection protein n=1 Tax=Candidatus Scybalomonas excrementavium TaxID=2840943 RepID=A0A9D9I0C6_9FIRM|nr:TetM/TetW/TetO/TetS family tetracycline resistance ribosomal protection protein [Candidatus Scybalomonas excrementavium]